jgi:ribonuclease-3
LTSEPGLLGALEQRLGHDFRDPGLLLRALTHASYANEHPPERDNESLAFLGDAVLALVVTERLWETAGDQPVGVLTPRRAALVAGEPLARWAGELGVGSCLRLGRGEELTGGREKESVLATALEAVLGALYLEGGLSAVRGVVARLAMW